MITARAAAWRGGCTGRPPWLRSWRRRSAYGRRHATFRPPRHRLLSLDSASLYFRAFYGVPDQRSDPSEPPTNALRGFLDMIATLVNAHHPTHLVACWDDDWRPQWRVDLVPTYKTHRLTEGSDRVEESPDDLSPQVPLIRDALRAIGIARVGAPGYEADAVIVPPATRHGSSP